MDSPRLSPRLVRAFSKEAQFESEFELFHVSDPTLLVLHLSTLIQISLIETVRVPKNGLNNQRILITKQPKLEV